MLYGDLRDRILRLLGNPDGEGIEPEIIVEAIAASHDAILPWVPKLAQTTIVGDGSSVAFDLPSNFYAVEAVIVNATGEILGRSVFTPNAYFGTNTQATNSWILLPTNHISFSKAPGTNVVYNLYYMATWNKPTIGVRDDDVLEPPDHLITAMSFYSTAYLLIPDSMSVSTGIAPYKTKVDSGNPEHNPIERSIMFMLNLFNQEMGRHPKYQRSQV